MGRNLKEPYEVAPSGSNWVIKLLTSDHAIEVHRTRQEAVTRAEELMKRNNRPMVVAKTRSGNMKTVSTNTRYLKNIERGIQ